ncbi:unnamed protein product [Pylaiella littoralis]
MRTLDREIARAEHLAAERLVTRLGSVLEALETEKSAADKRVSELQAKIVDETSNGGDVGEGADVSAGGSEALQKELSLTLTNLAKASTEVKLEKVALREKEELNANWGQILRAAKAERVDLEARASALRGRCAVLKERRRRVQQEVDRTRAQLFNTMENGSGGGGGDNGHDGALRAARRALDDHEASVKRAESRRTSVAISVSRTEAEVEERRSQAAGANAAVDEVWDRMRRIGSPLHTAADAEKYLRGVEDQRRLQRDRQLDLSRALESSRQSLAAAARRIGAPQWCLQLVVEKNSSVDAAGGGGGGGGDGGGSGRNGHRGFLFELFELRQGPQDTAKHSQALASLLAGSLSVWVCESSRDADQALDLARANLAGLRVWPIERLKAAAKARRGQGRSGRMRQALEWAEKKWPGQAKVTDPASVLLWDEEDEGVVAAMEKALGAWLITDDDDTSAIVLGELGMGSVTVSGVRHAPGEVTGGEVQGEAARLKAKLDWDRADRARREVEASLEACAEGCRDLTRRLEAGVELARLQERRIALKKEAQECAERLADSETKAAGARQKLEWADAERDRLKRHSAWLDEQQSGTSADPEEVLSVMRKALQGREGDLDTTSAACAQMDLEIGSLTEASMEALERENNAKEALGMNDSGRGGGAGNNSSSISTREEDDDNDDGEGEQEEEEEEEEREKSSGGGGGGARGGGGGSDGADETEGARDNGEEEEAAATAAVRDRFAAMKRAVESKMARVAELERARDDLTARVDAAIASEKGAGERVSALEEEAADAKALATDAGARLKAKRKGVREAERRVREAAARLGEGERSRTEVSGGGGGGGGSGGGGGGDGGDCSTIRGDTSSPAVRSVGGRSSDRAGRKRVSAAMVAAAGGSRGWQEGKAAAERGTGGTPGNGKENVPAPLTDGELLDKKHELAAKEKLLSSELRGLRRQSKEQQGRTGSGVGDRGRSGGAASRAVAAGSVNQVTVQKRRAKVSVLKQQLGSVLEGARQLEAGVVACEGRMHEANEDCYASVRGEVRTLFGALCRNKSADLVMTGPKLEDGLRLVVRNENTQVAAAAAAAAADAATAAPSAAAVVERSPRELSGGQQALLGLALVLALSSYQVPPLCLLDEVDAALDETNQAAAARLVALTFQNGQALCVSHHADFHRQSGQCVAVEMRDGVSECKA